MILNMERLTAILIFFGGILSFECPILLSIFVIYFGEKSIQGINLKGKVNRGLARVGIWLAYTSFTIGIAFLMIVPIRLVVIFLRK